MSKSTLRVSKIKNGTVIDHISSGRSLDVIKILGINGYTRGVVTIAMNVPSEKHSGKDMVKIEGRELNSEEVDRIALIAPHATINIIRNYKVSEKQMVKLPQILQDIVKCIKPSCISNNNNEPVKSIFYIDKEDPLKVRCHYCGNIIEEKDILQQF
jgi:aspartate carbamoyltransferase regulatory subunit